MASIIILWLLIIMLCILLIKQLNINKNILICIGISILIVLFALNIDTCIPAALSGAELWYKAILPTTFPFLIICNLLISYNGISAYSKILGPLICKPLGLSKNCSFPIAASILCGYPLGAKYSVDLYTMGYVDKEEYSRLLNIASNAGPVFLIGSIGSALLHNPVLGYILLIANYLSAALIGIFTRKKRTHNKLSSLSHNFSSVNFGTALKNAIENGIITVLSIGGFIIIFSVIISIIKSSTLITMFFYSIENLFKIKQNTIYAIFLGSIEITNGCNIISSLTISLPIKLALISFLCSFSGFAIIAQVSSFTSSVETNYLKYIFLKIIQGIISFIITYVVIKIIPLNTHTAIITPPYYNNILLCLLPAILILLLTFILKIIDKLFLHTA